VDLRYTAEETKFRDEVREFFRTAQPASIRKKMELGQRLSKDDIVTWQRILNAKGWAVPSWPVEWGGTGWGPVKTYIFKEEMQLAPAPDPLGFNVSMVGPVLIAFGSDAQKKHFLPKVANCDYWFCQGFSEPGAGSDLASLRTSAKRDGDHYIVNGQKIWTSRAQHADWMFCLVRTKSEGKPQTGISYLLIDVKTPGLTIRPIYTIDGEHHFNEVFFDNVRVPAENLVGEENKGWSYAKYLLGHERVGIARVGASKYRLQRAKALAESVYVGDIPLAKTLPRKSRID
jgi:alkylation response protein AidB-like acyl-CoA dehydrogenase